MDKKRHKKTNKLKEYIIKKAGIWLLCFTIFIGYFSVAVYAAEAMEEEQFAKIQEEREGRGESGKGQERRAVDSKRREWHEDTISGNMVEKTLKNTISGNTAEKRQESVSGNNEENFVNKQYHFTEGDYTSIKKWLDLYYPDGFGSLLSYDQEWWDNLYDYEQEYAEFLLHLIVELSEDVYAGQNLEECIRILENGTNAYDFFAGTIFYGLVLEDLQNLAESGYSLEDLEDFLAGAAGDGESALFQKYLSALDQDSVDSVGESLEKLTAVAEKLVPAFSEMYTLNDGDLVAKVVVNATGYSGTEHNRIYKITLGGRPALCLSHGKRCWRSFLYNANSGTYEKKNGPLGYFISHAANSGADYVACQIAAWIYMNSDNCTEAEVKSRTIAMINISSEEALGKMAASVWKYYSNAKGHPMDYYVFHSDNGNSQDLGVSDMPAAITYNAPAGSGGAGGSGGGNTISKTVTTTYMLEVYKRDWQTGAGLPGCEVDLFDEGEPVATVTTDNKGRAEFEVTKTETFSASYDGEKVTEEDAKAELSKQIEAFKAKKYTFSTSEVTAPKGYVWEANEKEIAIADGQTAVFNLTNERTLGAVELIKYDTESECDTAQGDAVLDGAVYGIYAAEDIVHQDGVKGIIYEKDELVQEAVVGKTPKRNADGYVMNTDGSRHIANSKGEIAYTDTPGKTLFGDLELGSYYIKEIKSAEGYMLDEAVYPVSFTYKWQNVKIENRNELAGSAVNELTADDGSTSKSVYSGDYVIKQGIQFVKTSDDTYHTELEPIKGAGFRIFLISDLTGVKNGSLKPLGDDWTADDIMSFYEYDFTGEQTATVYKRTGHEEWTEGDKLWLEAGSGRNEYHVKEMFTDADGRIVTPELPYGTYVVVETTTPERYVCAKPFIIYITQDGGVLYTDALKQTVEQAYTPEKSVRYGDHKETKNREGRVLQKQRFINNTITKAFLRVIKADEKYKPVPGTYIEAQEFVRGTVLKENAEYRIKCLTPELSRASLLALNWKSDAEGYLSYYDVNARELSGTKQNPFRTKFLRKNGVIVDCYITLPQEIPIGTYALTELTAPDGYVLSGQEQTVQNTSEERINGYEIIDSPLSEKEFTINNGAVYPDGQMGNNKFALMDEYGNLTVTVLQKNQEQKGIIEIYKHGEQLSGAHGDEETLLDKLKEEPSNTIFRTIMKSEEAGHKDLVFEYEDAPVEGAVFHIIAVEDIYTQELQKDLFDAYAVAPADYLIHHKGDVVAKITTDRNGFGYAAGLYIGKYKIVEVTAGSGFVRNTLETEFEITSQEQKVNFDIQSADYKNERQKLEITVEKQDGDSGKNLAGAIYGLYAEEDIFSNICQDTKTGKWVVRDVPEVLYLADTLLATCMTDETGKGIFDEDLPLGKYYVRELEGPAGYLTAAEDISVDGNYDSPEGGQDTELQKHQILFQNLKTQAVITKQDLANSKEVAGAEMEIREIEMDADGNFKKDAAGEYISKAVFSWISKGPGEEMHYFYRNEEGYLTEIEKNSELPAGKELVEKEGHLIRGLRTDRVYILSEKTAPYGYGYAEDILFKVVQEKEDGKLTGISGVYILNGEDWNRVSEDILVMYDEKQALDIEKSTIRMTQSGDNYKYTVDELKNLTEEALDHFTVSDKLSEKIYLTELWTGTYNENLLYNIEYKTNHSEEWVLWEDGLTTGENHHLTVPGDLRTTEKHISQFRLSFGTVGGEFGKVESPVYFTAVLPDVFGTITNEIELTAEQNGRPLRDRDETETVVYLGRIVGYSARGGGFPLYEIVETADEVTREEVSVRRQTIQETGPDRQEPDAPDTPEEIQKAYFESDVVKTGDDSPIYILLFLLIAAIAGLILLFRNPERGKKNRQSGKSEEEKNSRSGEPEEEKNSQSGKPEEEKNSQSGESEEEKNSPNGEPGGGESR